ncbi:unnamed protein product [Amoebophrya sp. A120]|nr:unnamed protein product [Amoebophrya sp. A120]|eukprot:GSA120T00005150001.1
MSSTETANKLKIALLKHPYRKYMQWQLSRVAPELVMVQVNNDVKKVHSQQTLLTSCHKDFKKKVPFNCRAGICGACEANVAYGPRDRFQVQRLCWTPVKEGARVLTLDQAMMNFRQGTADE